MKTQISFWLEKRPSLGSLNSRTSIIILSKCLEYKVKRLYTEKPRIYVDDLAAFSLAEYAEADQEKLTPYESSALRVWTRRKVKKNRLFKEIIGWFWDLAAGTVRLKNAAVDKLKLTLFVIIDNTAEFWSLRHVQVLVSLTIHYSKWLLGTSCFIRPFIDMLSGKARRANDLRFVTDTARFAVHIWRSLLLQSVFIAVPIFSLSLVSKDDFNF